MTTITPLFAAIIFMARASIAIAFVPPEPGRTYMSPSGRTPFSHIMTRQFILCASSTGEDPEETVQPQSKPVMPQSADLKELASQIDSKPARPRYQLGVGKNMPVPVYLEQNTTSVVHNEDPGSVNDGESSIGSRTSNVSVALNWNVPEPAKKKVERQKYDMGAGRNAPLSATPSEEDRSSMRTTRRLLPKGDELSAKLTKAVWDAGHFDDSTSSVDSVPSSSWQPASNEGIQSVAAPNTQQQIITDYQRIDLSIPPSVYSLGTSSPFESSQPAVDLVWDLMRHEAQIEAAREPLLVSFLYSTILNHPTLESAISFHLANRLSSPAMLSTQIMSLIREALDADPDFRRNLRADMLAVRDRDPACNCLPDVFLYFKGFHALQTYRVAHYLWRSGRRVLAHYMQSQVSQHFQIDIHPNATIGSGTMLDHGTGIVIGETAHLGHNCSVLHHVTLGGSGKKGVDRHPKVGNGVLLGAGASVLGNIKIGDGCQVGAGTLVIEDLPPRSVAVGVPAKIIGRFVDVTAQPSIGMNQLGSKEAEEDIVMFGMDGI
mmetsp:Transcript_7481/g.16981  ORF Transcript_7481/g.16981 Transcript_7481/m.16981 type:complete len:547 (+) Transcript_7481:120-1760(+)